MTSLTSKSATVVLTGTTSLSSPLLNSSGTNNNIKHKLLTLVLLAKQKNQPSATITSASSSTAVTSTSSSSHRYSLSNSPYSSILLGMKKRGFGVGKWNGFGGKVDANETIRQAAVRELKEECHIDIEPSALSKRAILLQEFEGDSTTMLEIHVYLGTKFNGEPQESEEMKPQWFDLDGKEMEREVATTAADDSAITTFSPSSAASTSTSPLPFHAMWLDDAYWYPLLLNDEYFRAHFLFRGHDIILEQKIQLLNEEERKRMEEQDP